MKAKRKLVLGLAGLAAVSAGLLQADSTPISAATVRAIEPSLQLNQFTRQAALILKGTVTKVEYRNAEPVPQRDVTGAPVLDNDGAPLLQDGSGLPHTFVTFQVDRTYKGRADSTRLTLRFLGGSFQDGPAGGGRVLEVGHAPLFDVGDQDILFVDGNGDAACPLVRCEDSRFRLIRGGKNREARVFTDLGHEVLRVIRSGLNEDIPDAELATGPLRQLQQVNENTIGDRIYRQVVEPATSTDRDDPLPAEPRRFARGPQLTEQSLEAAIVTKVQRMFTPAELRALPPVSSADITRPIRVEPLREATPSPGDAEDDQEQLSAQATSSELPEAERNAIAEQERRELAAFKASGGNPVLPPGTGR